MKLPRARARERWRPSRGSCRSRASPRCRSARWWTRAREACRCSRRPTAVRRRSAPSHPAGAAGGRDLPHPAGAHAARAQRRDLDRSAAGQRGDGGAGVPDLDAAAAAAGGRAQPDRQRQGTLSRGRRRERRHVAERDVDHHRSLRRQAPRSGAARSRYGIRGVTGR